jgi:hypothetical protein
MERRNPYTRSSITRCYVSFHTDEEFRDVPLTTGDVQIGQIIGVSTDKTIGQASGTFSITLKKPKADGPYSWLGFWRDPESVWVNIKFSADGKVFHTLFGQIDSVTEDTSRTGMGQRSETYTITGRDFGKVFETAEIFANLHTPQNNFVPSAIWTQWTLLEKQSGTPAHFLLALLETFLSNFGNIEAPWVLPASLGGNPFYDKLGLDYSSVQKMDANVHGYTMEPSLLSPDNMHGQKVWDLISEMSNSLINELFVDLGPRIDQSYYAGLNELQPKVYLRERPFPTRSDDNRTTNRSAWNNLPTHRLATRDVLSRSIAKGGASQRFNYWELRINDNEYGTDAFIQGLEGIFDGKPGGLPVYNPSSIRKHGLRRWSQSTRWLPVGTAAAPVEVYYRLAARWVKKLHDWYAPAPMQYSGMLKTTRLFPEIRIGHRVIEERDEGNIIYYVEGVSHAWQYPGAGVTTLTLTRGEYEGVDLLNYIYDEYEHPDSGRCIELSTASDEDETAYNELMDGLRRGSSFCVRNATGFDANHVVDGVSTPLEEHSRLITESETVPDDNGGSTEPAYSDTSMVPAIPTQEPLIENGELPPPQAIDQPQPITQESLESGRPWPAPDLLDFDLNDEDPIGGLGL